MRRYTMSDKKPSCR